MARLGKVDVSDADLRTLSTWELIELLVANGTSRLTARRIVEIARGGAEAGRARPHGARR